MPNRIKTIDVEASHVSHRTFSLYDGSFLYTMSEFVGGILCFFRILNGKITSAGFSQSSFFRGLQKGCLVWFHILRKGRNFMQCPTDGNALEQRLYWERFPTE